MGWLEEHLENFVAPVLGSDKVPNEPLSYFRSEELTVIKNSWRSVKKSARGRPILLPGRDVFIWEILAQREKYPTMFLPEVSRLTVAHVKIPDLEKYFLLDTGFAGSIPRGLGIDKGDFKLLSFSNNGGGIWSQLHGKDDTRTQVFPRLSFSRGLALKIELTPKYWNTARMHSESGVWGNGFEKVQQDKSPTAEFERAARLTIEIYKNSAAKFVPNHKPIVIHDYP
jgi:hypothetical protein